MNIKKIKEVCDLRPQKREAKLKLSDEALVSFVPMNNLGILSKNLNLYQEKKLKDVYKGYVYFAENDILLAKITPCFENGKLGIARNLKNGIGFGSSEYIVLRSKGEIDPEYLFYFLSQEKFRAEGRQVLSGAVGQQRVPNEFVENYLVPVPPIEEQKRIVEILDKAFEGIAQAEANTRQSLINIRNFFKRYLDKSIHKNNSNWDRVKFQDILSQQPRNGWSPPAENHSDIGVPVLTLSSVTGFHFNIQKIKFTNAPVKVGAHYWLNNGEFLMTRSNTSELVGHVAICENITEPTICCDLIMKMSINPQWAETKFIYWYFRTSKLRHLISNSAQGANPTMKKINKAIVQNFPVFIPPIVEQKKIVEQIEECYQKTQKLETIYQRKLEAIAELKQSILEKAFTGQLSQ